MKYTHFTHFSHIYFMLLEEFKTFVQEGCIKLNKSDSKGTDFVKDFYFK